MRKGFCLLLLLCFMWTAPALGEVYTDMASLSAAVAAAKQDATFTVGADLAGETADCILTNRTKAVITIDGQGHAIDTLIFEDGTFVLQNTQLDTGVLTSQKKDNTVRVTLAQDTTARTIGFADIAKGTLILRNEGFLRQAITYGTPAAITIENTGLIEGPSGVQLRDERFVDYKRVKNGKITLKNDGTIRGLTGAGVILSPQGGTSMSISGSGVIEGPVGLLLCANCVNDKAPVTINHTLRSCIADLEADPTSRRDFWLKLKDQAFQLGLAIPTEEEALTVDFQRKVRQAQVDQLLEGTGITHDQALGRALCITQTEKLPFSLTLTLKGTLWGENGLITLPDMNQKKGSLSIKSAIAEDSPSRRIDMVYLAHLLDVNPSSWPKKLSSLVTNSFGGKLPEGVTFHTQTVQATADGGAVYSSGWNGPAMMEMSASRTDKGKWQIEASPLPVPSEAPRHGDILRTIAQMPGDSLYRLDSDISLSSSAYGDDYRAASGPHTFDGNGFSILPPSSNAFSNSRLFLQKSMTVQNFHHFNGVNFWPRTKFEGKLTLQNIQQLGTTYIIDMSAHLSQVHLADDAILRANHSDSGTRTVTLDETFTSEYGFLDLDCHADNASKAGTLHVIQNAAVGNSSYYSIASLNASNGGTVKVTGSGVLGDWENAQPDRGVVCVRPYSGGKVILDQRIASLEIEAGADDTKYSKGSVQVGGQVRHLTVDCDSNADDVTLTVTASEMETFTVQLTCKDRTDPMTDKEAASYLKKNAPTIKASKATNANGERMQPLYQIFNDRGTLLWEGKKASSK